MNKLNIEFLNLNEQFLLFVHSLLLKDEQVLQKSKESFYFSTTFYLGVPDVSSSLSFRKKFLLKCFFFTTFIQYCMFLGISGGQSLLCTGNMT